MSDNLHIYLKLNNAFRQLIYRSGVHDLELVINKGELFDLGKLIDSNLNILQADGYACPTCGEEPPEGKYTVAGIVYPVIIKEVKGSTPDGKYHDWTEIHCCKKDQTWYKYQNGAY